MANDHNPSHFSLMYGYVPNEVQPVHFERSCPLSSRVFFFQRSHSLSLLSPWHDILLLSPNGFLTMVCTTPAGDLIMRRPAADESFNPLQALNVTSTDSYPISGPAEYPFPVYWNVGFLPQTRLLPCDGGPGPVQVVDIGSYKERRVGHVYSIKPIGACCLQQEGQKTMIVISVAADDSMAGSINDISDVAETLPGFLGHLCVWLRESVLSTNRERRNIIFESQAKTQKLIFDYHDDWHNYAIATVDDCPLSPSSEVTGSDDEIADCSDSNSQSQKNNFFESPSEQEYKESMARIIKEQFQIQMGGWNLKKPDNSRMCFLKKARNGIRWLFKLPGMTNFDQKGIPDSDLLANELDNGLAISTRRRSCSDMEEGCEGSSKDSEKSWRRMSEDHESISNVLYTKV